MSHFAQVKNGIVQQVIVAEQPFIDTLPDKQDWVQTSYNTRSGIHYGQDGKPDGGTALRGNYAGIGYIYDSKNDVFYPQRPKDENGVIYNSWVISGPDWTWKPPIPYPTDGNTYLWDEPSISWKLVV